MRNGLRQWRHRFGIQDHVAAAVLGISPELFGRIECGQVEPEPQLAMRIHVLTIGAVPVSAWGDRVRLQLIDGHMPIRAVAARQADGSWGVNLFLGDELIARYGAADALELSAELRQVAELAGAPPVPMDPPAKLKTCCGAAALSDRIGKRLPDGAICNRCGATLATYADQCTAALDDPCPGFVALEEALAQAEGGQ